MRCTANTKSGSQCKKQAINGTTFCNIHTQGTDQNDLQTEFETLKLYAEQFSENIQQQITTILTNHEMTLGVPIERRVKTWSSIEAKLKRHTLQLTSLTELPDFVGLRIILLFKRDLARIGNLITSTFDVISHVDKSTSLEDTQFGYQSIHYIIQLPENWLDVPTMSNFRGLQAEIQVRTLSQHIWAAASHKLQYKHEASVPQPLRRSIHRISAILEIVDIEFERMLTDRARYLESSDLERTGDTLLNVDVLQIILNNLWPLENRSDDEDYSILLQELNETNITTVVQLTSLIENHREASLREDMKRVTAMIQKISRGITANTTIRGWTERGAYFSHVGLTRIAMSLHSYGNAHEMEFPLELHKTRSN